MFVELGIAGGISQQLEMFVNKKGKDFKFSLLVVEFKLAPLKFGQDTATQEQVATDNQGKNVPTTRGGGGAELTSIASGGPKDGSHSGLVS